MCKRLLSFILVGVFTYAAVGAAQAADPRMPQAVEELTFLNFEKAQELFTRIRNAAAPGSEDWQQATFGAAVAAQQLLPMTDARMDLARDLYQQLVDKSPDSKYAPRAMLNLGRIEELRYDPGKENLDGAREKYLEAVKRWPNQPIASEATLRAASTYVQSYDKAQVEKGVTLITEWLKSHPNDPLETVMWQYLGDTYFYPLADYQKSLDAYEQAEKIGWIDPTGEGKTYWRIAVMSERDLKNFASAVKYYTLIISRTPTSGKAYEAQQALKRLGAPVPEMPTFLSAEETARGK